MLETSGSCYSILTLLSVLNCDHYKSPFIVMLLANNALIITLGLYRCYCKLQMPISELCGKLVKDGLHKHQLLVSQCTGPGLKRLQSETQLWQAMP